MEFLRSVGAKLRGANDALADAQKSWRDEGLTNRQLALEKKEELLNIRAKDLDSREDELRRFQRDKSLRKFKYAAVALLVSVPAYMAGFIIGSQQNPVIPFNNGSQNGSNDKRSVGQPPRTSATSADTVLPIPVSSDPGARYWMMSWSSMQNGNRMVVTRRIGSSGERYSRREIDCSGMTFRYLGEGDTISEAAQDSVNIGEMTALISGSISAEVANFVCAR